MCQRYCWGLQLVLNRLREPALSDRAHPFQVSPQLGGARVLKIEIEEAISFTCFQKSVDFFRVLVEEITEFYRKEISGLDVVVGVGLGQHDGVSDR